MSQKTNKTKKKTTTPEFNFIIFEIYRKKRSILLLLLL